jgi:hypothetical protein
VAGLSEPTTSERTLTYRIQPEMFFGLNFVCSLARSNDFHVETSSLATNNSATMVCSAFQPFEDIEVCDATRDVEEPDISSFMRQ